MMRDSKDALSGLTQRAWDFLVEDGLRRLLFIPIWLEIVLSTFNKRNKLDISLGEVETTLAMSGKCLDVL